MSTSKTDQIFVAHPIVLPENPQIQVLTEKNWQWKPIETWKPPETTAVLPEMQTRWNEKYRQCWKVEKRIFDFCYKLKVSEYQKQFFLNLYCQKNEIYIRQNSSLPSWTCIYICRPRSRKFLDFLPWNTKIFEKPITFDPKTARTV